MIVAALALLGVAYLVAAVLIAGRLPDERPRRWAEFAAAGAWGLIWPVCVAVLAVASALPAAVGWAGVQVRDRRLHDAPTDGRTAPSEASESGPHPHR
jgi:hypothetical protein